MEFGAHVSASGGIYTAIDRIEAIGGDCVQVFTQSPRMWRPTEHKPDAIARFRERRQEAVDRRRRLPCALPLQPRCPRRHDLREVDRHAADTSTPRRDRRGRGHLPRGLAPRSGLEAGLDRTAAGSRADPGRYDADTWLLIENSAGTGDTIGRSVDELVVLVDRLDGHPRLGHLPRLVPPLRVGYDVGDPAAVDALVADLDDRIGLDRIRALHVNDSATPLGSNRDRHANLLEGEIGERLGVFLAHPAFQDLGAYLEVPAISEDGAPRSSSCASCTHATSDSSQTRVRREVCFVTVCSPAVCDIPPTGGVQRVR